MDHLWAPWRMRFIRSSRNVPGCLFCRVFASNADRKNLVLVRRDAALLMLNRYPYNPGHLMVAAARHTGRIAGLRAAERADLMELLGLAERVLRREYRPHGLNVGANLGRVAGAGFPGHLHFHLVPRWNGDTNFMPVIGQTRVLPESLAETWSRLRRAVLAVEGSRRRVSASSR